MTEEIERIKNIIFTAGIQWGDRSPDEVITALDAMGYAIVEKKKISNESPVMGAIRFGDRIKQIARAICKSRSCQGVNCCQWPANLGRLDCPVKNGDYDDAAFAAICGLTD